ncbi:ATP-binding cassette domain-containing protein [Algoriphagus sediminis]|uniref:ATP-binding cassette domain-containing protein n=1 Tax=Algoriphagus sediminis TaxID=3057113 RepID=A0ABT7Y814_9BACT|nr:ATP-binding cassette domain-containing protein [Algoriphagus sediminis]MDN3202653.1 ATP-binding cassette domain-containing protein [Algoriphagus sediminis]
MSFFLHLFKGEVIWKGDKVIGNLSFFMSYGECWAILSKSGLRQSAFLKTILGRTLLKSGQINYSFAADYLDQMKSKGEVHSPQDLISYVSHEYKFRNKSNLQNFYFQQRFNSSEVDEALTVKEYLNQFGSPKPGEWTTKKVSELLKLNDLLDESILKLSNGETRRLDIALGLLKQPKLFLLDHPTTGLDRKSRETFGEILENIIAEGVHVILSCSEYEIPKGVTHVGYLEEGGLRVLQSEQLKSVRSKSFKYPIDRKELTHLSIGDLPLNQEMVKLKNVEIKYGAKIILKNLSWRVNAGERWQIKGPNGSGKSTLISLLIGENPQAYSQDIWLFEKKRGSGESIWDIKKPIGFVAPELARFFPSNQTCRKVILSGLFDTMGLFRKPSQEQYDLADRWVRLFGLESSENVLIQRASLRDQRWTLLARALIKKPKLLILDEASQGLDDLERQIFKETIETLCRNSNITVLYVSHYDSDVPKSIDKILDMS